MKKSKLLTFTSHVKRNVIVTSAVNPVSIKPRLASTVKRSFGVTAVGIQTAVVSFDGALVDI